MGQAAVELDMIVTEESMSRPTRYREVEVSGTPREIGRQIGETAGAEIRGFCDTALERVNKTVRVSHEAARAVAVESLAFAEAYSPEMVEELRGMAETARVDLAELMLLQVRNQLQPEKEAGCTSLAIDGTGPIQGNGLVAQNWDNDPALDPFTIVLTRRPAGKPAMMTLTQAGLIAYIGFNEAGVGLCLNTLPAPARRVGVPHYFTVRKIYESNSLAGAVRAVEVAARAIPANIMMITPQGPADLEITLDGVRVLRNEKAKHITHTNHCLHPELANVNAQFPELIQSHARQSRIAQLIESGTSDLKCVQHALADHDRYPYSICRHANDDPATGFWQTVFSVIIEPGKRRMHVTRGTPCEKPYETYEMHG
jgi:isopenicillin-N N-acyltransferase-like protein